MASFFRNRSNSGGFSSMPSSIPKRFTSEPAARLRTTHSTGTISSFLTRHSVSDNSASIWVGIPASASLLIMKWLNLLFTMPLRSNCSMRAPSPADVSLRNSSINRSGFSVLYTVFALPRYNSACFCIFVTPVMINDKNLCFSADAHVCVTIH